MTTRNDEHRERELESLYREAGDAEPSDGLDRIIRARADQAAERTRRRRFAPWIGGLATASVAIVAVTLAIRQTPLDPLSERLVPGEPTTADDTRPGESGGPSTGNAPAARRQTAPPPAAPARSAALREGGADVDTEGGRSSEFAAEAPNTTAPSEPSSPDDAAAPTATAKEMLAAIEAALARGETAQARAWARRLAERHPDHPLPEEVRSLLDAKPLDDNGS
jgi:hypothetical protein